MVSQHIINVILKAEDQISQTVQKVKKQVDDFGSSSKQSFDKSTQSSKQFQESVDKIRNPLEKSKNTIKETGMVGRTAFLNMSNAEKQALMSLKTHEQRMQSLAQKIGVAGGGAVRASQQFQQIKLNPELLSDIQRANIKITEMGVDITSTKGKIMVLGTAISTSLVSKWDTVKAKVSTVASSIRTKLGSALDSVKSKVSAVGTSFQTMGGMIASAIGALGVNSVKDLTVGLSLSREKMSSLNTAIMGSKTASDALLGSIDTMTNSSVVSMDQMVNAMNKIKLSTSMSNEQLAGTKDVVMKLGEASMLMGNDTQTATYQMGEAFSGLNGDFQILKENFGITKDKMKAMGWSGEASDVEGYTKALEKCLSGLGDLGGVMDTTSGSIARVQKIFRTAGRQMGDQVTPYIKKACDEFIRLNDEMPGLTKGIIAAGGALAGFATVAPYINDFAKPISDSITSIRTIGETARDACSAVKTGFMAAKTAIDLMRGATTLATLAEEGNATASAILSAKDTILAAKNWLVAQSQAALNLVMSANPIMIVVIAIAALIAILVYLYYNNEQVHDAIDGVFAAMQGVGEWLMSNLVPALQGFGELLMQIFEAITSSEAFQFMVEILTIVADTILQIIDLFTQFAEGQISLQDLLIGVGQALLEGYVTILTTILTTVANFIIQILTIAVQGAMNVVMGILSWISQIPIRVGNYILQTLTRIIVGMAQWVANARNKASSMVSAVVSFISRLPGRVYGFIVNTATRIANGASQWVANARSKASQVVSAVISHISQLPGKVYNEFMNIGSRILSAGSDLVNKARQIGKNIVDSMLGAMGIHSPGIIQNKVTAEFENTLDNVANLTSKAENVGAAVGEGLVSSYSDFKLPEQTLTANVQTNTDTSNNDDEDSQEEVDNQNTTLNAMVANVNDKYNQMKSLAGIDLSQLQLMNTQAFTNIRANEMAQMNMMTNHINTSLLNILNYTQNGLLQAYNITRENLSKMQNSTTRITKEMVKAWNSMKNSIVSAAKNIKKEASSYFNQLGSTIGGFYRKLQNPNLWGAGPNNTGMMQRNRVVGRASSGGSSSGMSVMSRILASSIRREKHIPEYISTVQAQTIPCITPGIIEYNANNGRINTTELIRGGVVSPDCLPTNSRSGAGPWENTVYPNVRKIKDTVNTWSMKGPSIHTGAGNVDTGLAFKVRDFATGTPNISFDSFKQMAQAIFRTVPYDHYSDSEKYGSWQNAIAAGRCNCSDGADALLALANTCGFSGEKVHCYWDGEGHFCTRINGQIMDTTAMQQRGTWISSAVTGYGSGPAPKRVGRQTVARSSGFTESENENNGLNGDFMLGGEITVKHEFENLPENVDEATIVQMIQETTNSDSWIKNLANNIRFQVADAKAKTKIERRQNRSRGNIA